MGTIIAPNRTPLLMEPHKLGPYMDKHRETHERHNPEVLSERFMNGVLGAIRDDSSLILRGQEQFDRLVSMINGRIKELRTDSRGYLETIDSDRSEVKLLVRNFINPFTYFFREGDVLREFERRLKERAGKKASGRIRIWNPGCSYGAETYSIAMIIKEIKAVIKGIRSNILATDINNNALGVAKSGEYSPEFVDDSTDIVGYLKKFKCRGLLKKNPRGTFSVDKSLAQEVRFERHNLLSDEYPEGVDFVFCRHVIMHMKKESVKRVASRIRESMNKGGILFVGKQESFTYTNMIENAGFVPEHHTDPHILTDFYTFMKH